MAITFDNSGAWSTTSAGNFTNAFTITGTNPLLHVSTRIRSTESSVTGVTYNGVAMTQIAQITNIFSNVDLTMWILMAPATGANNIVVSQTGTPSSALQVYAGSYTGAAQTGQPDSTNSGKVSGVTTQTLSTTVVASNCWLVGQATNDFATMTVDGTPPTVIRNQGNDGAPTIDSGVIVSTGSQSMEVNTSGSASIGMVMASITPAAAAAAANHWLLMGV